MYPRSFSSSNREKSHLEAPPLPLLNGGLLFSFSKSLKGSRVNLFPGEEGREGWERRQFRNNKRGREGLLGWKKACTRGIVSRRRSQISSSDSFVDAGRARAIESKGFPVCCSSIGEQSLRRIPIRFQSLGNAFIAFLYFSFLFGWEIFLEPKRLLFLANFRFPSIERGSFWRENGEEDSALGTSRLFLAFPRLLFRPTEKFFLFSWNDRNMNNVNFDVPLQKFLFDDMPTSKFSFLYKFPLRKAARKRIARNFH